MRIFLAAPSRGLAPARSSLPVALAANTGGTGGRGGRPDSGGTSSGRGKEEDTSSQAEEVMRLVQSGDVNGVMSLVETAEKKGVKKTMARLLPITRLLVELSYRIHPDSDGPGA
eukprot:tig00021043_g17615.t1